MNLHTLTPAEGSRHKKKRIGRGQGSTRGGTSTRGHKGAQSRSGYKRRAGFEGGQQPLQRRVPKFGFTPPSPILYKPLNLDSIDKLLEKESSKTLSISDIIQKGLAGKKDRIKVLARGDWRKSVDIEAHAFSKSAKLRIEKAGGKALCVPFKPKREASSS